MKTTLIILFLLSNTFLFTTCKQPGASPCKEPTADFTMVEYLPTYYFGFTEYDGDTLNAGYVQFTALEPNAKYEWKIGTDTTVFTKQQFMLDFYPYYSQYYPTVPPITVTLKVTKSPSSCFPASDSVKFMTRILCVTDTSLLNGSFKVHFNNDTVEKILHINTDTIMNFHIAKGIYIKGLPQHDSIFMNDGSSGELVFYRKLIFNFTSTGANLNIDDLGKGEIMVTPNGETIYGWITQTDPNLPPTYTFTGTRIK